jgi:hypothetical protein
MERNDDYDIVCPECGSTKTDWIDYDPETAKGRKNREKYCNEKYYKPDPQAECVQCSWKGLIEDLHYPEDGSDGVCPKCKEPVEFTNSEEKTVTQNTGWPFGPSETKPAEEKKELTAWTVSTYYKKSIEEVEHFTKDGMEIIHSTGWRSGSWTVYTNDGKPPEFEFTGSRLDINSCYANNIEEAELVETNDGCWDDMEWPDDIDSEERSAIEEQMEEDGYYDALESNDWWSSDTEMWLNGPILIEGDNGYRRIIEADENGNVTEFKED